MPNIKKSLLGILLAGALTLGITGRARAQEPSTNIYFNTIGGITNDVSVNWNYGTQCLFTAESSGNGVLDGDTNEWKFAGSSFYTLAKSAEGSYFAGWTGDIVSTENPLINIIDRSIDVTANFREKPRILMPEYRPPENRAVLSFKGLETGQRYEVEESTNLASSIWNPITNFTATAEDAELDIDWNSGNAERFYRVKLKR